MHTVLMLLAATGFANAAYLFAQYRRHQATGTPMVCLFGTRCGDVVLSRWGKSFGVKNELWGMLYYLVIIILSLPLLPTGPIQQRGIQLSTLAAAMFSTYLLYVQIFVLRKFCMWCLLAIGINYALFFFAVRF